MRYAPVLVCLLAFAATGCTTQRAMQQRIDTLEARVAELEARPVVWPLDELSEPQPTEAERPWWDPGLFWHPIEGRAWTARPYIQPDTQTPFFSTGPGRYGSIELANIYFNYIEICVGYLSVGPAYADSLKQSHPYRDPRNRRYFFRGVMEAQDAAPAQRMNLEGGVFGAIRLEERDFDLSFKAEHHAGAIRLPVDR